MKSFTVGTSGASTPFPRQCFLIMASWGVGRPLRAKSSRILSRFHLRLYVSTRFTSGRAKRFSLIARSGPAPRHGLSWSCPHAYDGSEPCLIPFGVYSSYQLLIRLSTHGRGCRQAEDKGRKENPSVAKKAERSKEGMKRTGGRHL